MRWTNLSDAFAGSVCAVLAWSRERFVSQPPREESSIATAQPVVLTNARFCGCKSWCILWNIEEGTEMRVVKRMFALVCALLCFATVSHAATVTGTVKGPAGAPLEGAVVQAQTTTSAPASNW